MTSSYPVYTPWSRSVSLGVPKGEWRDRQLRKFLDFKLDCNSGDVKKWLQNHDVDPWPHVTKKKLKDFIASIRKDQTDNGSPPKKRRLSGSNTSYHRIKNEVRNLIGKLTSLLREQVLTELLLDVSDHGSPIMKHQNLKVAAFDYLQEIYDFLKKQRDAESIKVKRILVTAVAGPIFAKNTLSRLFDINFGVTLRYFLICGTKF